MASDLNTYVLIPGAGHGGWAWQPVAERLCAAGHRAVPVTLPGMGACERRTGYHLADAAARVIDVIDECGFERVTLVGHSMGGIVVAAVAARISDRLDGLVFVSAYVPRPGESFSTAREGSKVGDALTDDADQTTEISLDALTNVLMQGVAEDTQRLVHNLMTPTPGGYTTDAYEGPDVRTFNVPTRYIHGRDDIALVRPAAELAERAGAEPQPVPGTHEALLTHPDEVAEAILA